jgi:hypothetical protein
MNRKELFERISPELFQGPRAFRGYRPLDDAVEPSKPPSGPSGISRPETEASAQEARRDEPQRLQQDER